VSSTFNLVHSYPVRPLFTTAHPPCRRSTSHASPSALATLPPLAAPLAHRQLCDQHGRPALHHLAFLRRSRKSSTSSPSNLPAPSALPSKSPRRPLPKPRPRSLKSTNRLRSTSRPLSRPMARARSCTPMSVVVLPQSSKAMSTLRPAKLAVPRTTLCDGDTRATGVTTAVLPTSRPALSSF